MPFDDAKWEKHAIQGDLGGVALTLSVALDAVRDALKNIKDGKDISDEIDTINRQSIKLDKMFDQLTGYKPDGR